MSHTPRAQDVARFVGARLRARRVEIGLSQQALAALLRVSTQQIHKYETGASRLVSERLFALSAALDVDIGYFFDGLMGGDRRPHPEQRVVLDLVRAFRRIGCAKRKQYLLRLARILSEDGLESNPTAVSVAG